MSAAVEHKDANGIFEHVSESFRRGQDDKAAFRRRGENAISSGLVTEIPVWDISVEDLPEGAGTANVRFRFKAKGAGIGENSFIGKGVFVRDPDGQWRLQTFGVYLPTNERDEFTVQGL
jgi:hypothetical protein